MHLKRLVILCFTLITVRGAPSSTSTTPSQFSSPISTMERTISSSRVVAFSPSDVGHYLISMDSARNTFWKWKDTIKIAVGFLAARICPIQLQPLFQLVSSLLQNKPLNFPMSTANPSINPAGGGGVTIGSSSLSNSLKSYGVGFSSGWLAAESSAFLNQRLIASSCIRNGSQIVMELADLKQQTSIYREKMRNCTFYQTLNSEKLSKLNSRYISVHAELSSKNESLNFFKNAYDQCQNHSQLSDSRLVVSQESITSLGASLLKCETNNTVVSLKMQYLDAQLEKIKYTSTLDSSIDSRKDKLYWSKVSHYYLPGQCNLGVKAVPILDLYRGEESGIVVCRQLQDTIAEYAKQILIMSFSFVLGYSTRVCIGIIGGSNNRIVETRNS